MLSTRRDILRIFGAGILGPLAGCGEGNEVGPDVRLTLSNATENQQEIHIEILPASAEADRSESTLFEQWITLGPSGTENASKDFTEAFQSQKAHIRIGNEIGVIGEFTFVPDCPQESSIEEAVRIYLASSHSVAFDQNTCG